MEECKIHIHTRFVPGVFRVRPCSSGGDLGYRAPQGPSCSLLSPFRFSTSRKGREAERRHLLIRSSCITFQGLPPPRGPRSSVTSRGPGVEAVIGVLHLPKRPGGEHGPGGVEKTREAQPGLVSPSRSDRLVLR